MSTRCNIHFDAHGETYANVDRHSDGYPDGEYGVRAGRRAVFHGSRDRRPTRGSPTLSTYPPSPLSGSRCSMRPLAVRSTSSAWA